MPFAKNRINEIIAACLGDLADDDCGRVLDIAERLKPEMTGNQRLRLEAYRNNLDQPFSAIARKFNVSQSVIKENLTKAAMRLPEARKRFDGRIVF